MTAPALTYVTSGPWGAGTGTPLAAPDADGNFWAVAQALAGLRQDIPAAARGIASVSVEGSLMTITATDGTVLFTGSLPVPFVTARGLWVADRAYASGDVVVYRGVAAMARIDHRSSADWWADLRADRWAMIAGAAAPSPTEIDAQGAFYGSRSAVFEVPGGLALAPGMDAVAQSDTDPTVRLGGSITGYAVDAHGLWWLTLAVDRLEGLPPLPLAGWTITTGGGGGLKYLTETQEGATVVLSAEGGIALSPGYNGALSTFVQDGGGTAQGDTRGAWAVDWQLLRYSASEIASGQWSVVSGGRANTAQGQASVVGGGWSNAAHAPETTVSGGRGNTASDAGATVAGGGDNAAGSYRATVSGGGNNQAVGPFSAISGGSENRASDFATAVLGGEGNEATAPGAAVTGGSWNVADAPRSRAGGDMAHTRGLAGSDAWSSGALSAPGDSQVRRVVLRVRTTDDTPVVLTSNPWSAPSLSTVPSLPDDATAVVRLSVACQRQDAPGGGGWEATVVLRRDAGAASTVLLGSPVVTPLGATDPAWTVAVAADTTLGGLSVTVTGAAGQTLRWAALAELTESVYASAS